MAHVHVVIIGLAKRGNAPREKRLFSYDAPKGDPQESQHAALSPYLFDAGGLADARVVVKESAQALNGLPKLIIGSKPIDGGHYIFNADERSAFLREEPMQSHICVPLWEAVSFCRAASAGYCTWPMCHLKC